MSTLYRELLAQRTNSDGTVFSPVNNKPKTRPISDVQHDVTAVLLKKLTTKAGRVILSLLCQEDISDCEKLNADTVFISSIDPACVEHLDLKPGIKVSIRVGVTKNRGRTYVDAYSVKILNGGNSNMKAFEDKHELFYFPSTGQEMKQYDLLFPMTDFYQEDDFAEAQSGFMIERPTNTEIDDGKFGFSRALGLEFCQWRNSTNPENDARFYRVNLRANLQVLSQAFGVTNEVHWRDNAYADLWLLQADMIALCSLSCNTHAFVRIADEVPSVMYATVNALIVDLPATVRKIGEKLTPATMAHLYSQDNKENVEEQEKDTRAVVNLTETSDHQVDHTLYDYYGVGNKNSVFDLFAIFRC